MQKLRILIVDDYETVREGIKSILSAQADMVVVAEAADGQSAVAQAAALTPDVVVMDVSMPDVNGLEATGAIKRSCPHTKVIALTRHGDDGYLQQMLRAGVSAYVLKQSRSSELLRAIRAVAAGGSYLDPAVTGRVLSTYASARPAPPAPGDPGVSPREEEILRLVSRGHSNKEIASQLGVAVKTVETHKANAMQKLGLRSRIDVVKLAILHGWLREG